MAAKGSPVDLVEFMVKGIVSSPDDVRVHELENGKRLELETAPADRGRVIGRQGRMAKAMRAVLGASRRGASCRLDVVD
jgi:predicted RNA-binding protein YlqC (UPF0109 family)